MAVIAPADKRFRRAHVKPSRGRSAASGWRRRIVFAAVLIVLSAYAANRFVAVVTRLAVLRVEQITIHGNDRLSNGEVLSMLHGLRGSSMLTVDLEQWRAVLTRSPWIADALLRRSLPSTIDVTIVERSPIGIGRISGGLYLIDQRGMVIDEYGPGYHDLDLPIIDGFSADAETANLSRALLVGRLLDALRARNLAGHLSQIDVHDSHNAVVLLEGDTTLLRLGHERFAERLVSYLELAPTLRDRVPAIDYVDLRFDERIYVGPASRRTGSQGPGTAKPAREKRL
jgi:cell division protein FtsQ